MAVFMRSGTTTKRKVLTGVGIVAIAGVMAAGGYLVYTGLNAPSETVSADAPLPAAADIVADFAPTVGETCFDVLCPVENTDTGSDPAAWENIWAGDDVFEMSVQNMAPGSVFVPASKTYAQVRGTQDFEPSQYAGFTSIDVPNNPRRGFWYSEGASLVAGDGAAPGYDRYGTTTLGTHAGFNGQWGSFINIASLTGNEVIWTKDWDGNVQRWQVSRVHVMNHLEFPQEYWSTDGPRTLVLTTCGGPAGEAGQYSHNVFVEAVPVELDGSKWKIAEEEERIKAREAAIAAKAAPLLSIVPWLQERIHTELSTMERLATIEKEAATLQERQAQLDAQTQAEDDAAAAKKAEAERVARERGTVATPVEPEGAFDIPPPNVDQLTGLLPVPVP